VRDRPPTSAGPSWDALVQGGAGVPLATEDIYQSGIDEHADAGGAQRFLTFMLAGEEYALDILRIREITRNRPVTEVPRAPCFVLGIISVRGVIVPLVDLRLRLGLRAAPLGPAARILIVTRGDDSYGLIVDEVVHVVRLHPEDLETPPPIVGGGESEYVAAVGRPLAIQMPGTQSRILIVLNLDAVLAFEVGRGAQASAPPPRPGPPLGIERRRGARLGPEARGLVLPNRTGRTTPGGRGGTEQG
jgi:purine-binding chemotaxis protein CheW